MYKIILNMFCISIRKYELCNFVQLILFVTQVAFASRLALQK